VRSERTCGARAEEHQLHYPHAYEWSDAHWDWRLGTDEERAAAELAALKEYLARST
jgi:hypothetical protein